MEIGRTKRLEGETHQTSLVLRRSTYETITRLAAGTHRDRSEVMREMIENGCKAQVADDQADYIRRQIHQELSAYMDPQIERLAKIAVKGSVTSAASFYLVAEFLFKLMAEALIEMKIVPPTFQAEYGHVLEQMKKKGVRYVKMRESELKNEGW